MICRKCNEKIADSSIFCSLCGAKQTVSPQLHKPKTRGNGQGSVYKLPNGKYRAAVTLGYADDGKRIYKTKSDFKTKKEGIAYLEQLKNNAKLPDNIKFSELYKEWNAIHYTDISKSKKAAYVIAYNKCEPLYYRNIADLRVKDLQEVIDSASGYYPKHDIKVLCNLMFKYAVQNDYINKNYAAFVKLPPLPKSNRDIFTDKEISSLFDDYNVGNDIAGYVLIMIYTGMRYGELKILKKSNIFLAENYMIGGIKTEAGIDRIIAIHDKIKPIIEKLYNLRKIKLLEMNENNFYAQYYETLEKLKINKKTPHCCRHTFATLMAQSGAQPAIIKALAGHEKYSTTLQYTHIQLSEMLKAVNKI